MEPPRSKRMRITISSSITNRQLLSGNDLIPGLSSLPVRWPHRSGYEMRIGLCHFMVRFLNPLFEPKIELLRLKKRRQIKDLIIISIASLGPPCKKGKSSGILRGHQRPQDSFMDNNPILSNRKATWDMLFPFCPCNCPLACHPDALVQRQSQSVNVRGRPD